MDARRIVHGMPLASDPALGFQLGINAGMLPGQLFLHRRAAEIHQPLRLPVRLQRVNDMARPFGIYGMERVLLFRLLDRKAWELVCNDGGVYPHHSRREAASCRTSPRTTSKPSKFSLDAGAGQQADRMAALPQGFCRRQADKAACRR